MIDSPDQADRKIEELRTSASLYATTFAWIVGFYMGLLMVEPRLPTLALAGVLASATGWQWWRARGRWQAYRRVAQAASQAAALRARQHPRVPAGYTTIVNTTGEPINAGDTIVVTDDGKIRVVH